jgi:uncharacterized protein (DUF427 family)
MARSPAYDEHPNHKIEIEANDYNVRVVWNGHTVAETRRAKRLLEGRYDPAFYIPIEDADRAFLERTQHSTHCPFKGDAGYYSLRSGDQIDENAVWVYEEPFDQVMAIRDHIAFYPDRVTIEQA